MAATYSWLSAFFHPRNPRKLKVVSGKARLPS